MARNRFRLFGRWSNTQLGAGIILLVLGVLIGHVGTVVSDSRSLYDRVTGTTAIGPLQIGSFFPHQWRAVFDERYTLDAANDPVEVIAATSQPFVSKSYGQGDLLVVGWDPILRRWTTIFDMAKNQPYSVSQNPGYSPPENNALLVNVQAISVPGYVAGKSDLAISTNWQFAALPSEQIVDVIQFSDQFATVVYSYDNYGPGSIASVPIGGSQALQIRYTEYTSSDAFCCPARSAYFDLAPVNAYSDEAVKDNRSWTGAYVVQDSLDATQGFTVLAVDSQYLHGALQVGDVITNVVDTSATGSGESSKSILDTVARGYPQDVVLINGERANGTAFSSRIVLRSYLQQFLRDKYGDLRAKASMPYGIGAQFGTALSGTTPQGVQPGVYLTFVSGGPLGSETQHTPFNPDGSQLYQVRVVSVDNVVPSTAFDAYRLVAKNGARPLSITLAADGEVSTFQVSATPSDADPYRSANELLEYPIAF